MKYLLYILCTIIFLLAILFVILIQVSNSVLEQNASTTQRFVGTVEITNCDKIVGWAWDPNQPSAPIKVKAIVDNKDLHGNPISTVIADIERKDIASLVTDDSGKHGFEIPIPQSLKDNKPHDIYVYAVDFYDTNSITRLDRSPSSLLCKN